MFNLLKTYFKSLSKTKKGQAMVEYGLILALVSVVAILILTGIGSNLVTKFTAVKNALT